MTAIVERRKHKRISFNVSVTVIRSNQQLFEGGIANVSACGIAIVADKEAEVGEEVLLSFELMQEMNFDRIKGKVIRKEPISSEFLIGISFVDMTDAGKKKIEDFVGILQLVKKTFLFNTLDNEEIKQIVTIGKIENYTADKPIFTENIDANALYIIISGAVKITKSVSMGVQGTREETIALMREGEIFGEMALLDDYPRAASAIAHRDSQVLAIEKNNFRILLKGETDLAKTFMDFC